MRPISVKYLDSHNWVGAVSLPGAQAAEVFHAFCNRVVPGHAGQSAGPVPGEAAEDRA